MKKNGLNILFRTAGGKAPKKELGLGHVFRCLNLASELKGNKIHFLLEDFGGAKKIVLQRGYQNIRVLKKEIDLKQDLKIVQKYIKNKKIDLLIVDRYHVKIPYLKKLQKLVKLVVISDLQNFEFPGDLVVNGFIGFNNKVKKNSFGTKCLLGPHYQILNKKFSERSIRKKQKFDLLVTVGGFDEKNIIDVFLKCLEPNITKIKTKIILGPATSKSKLTKMLEKKYPSNLKIIKSTMDMKQEISKTRFGICSGGITTYEFASMKKPFGIISHVDHQLITASEWEKKGYAKNLGKVGRKTQKDIKNLLNKIVLGQIPYKIKNKNLVDGKGCLRVSREILKFSNYSKDGYQ